VYLAFSAQMSLLMFCEILGYWNLKLHKLTFKKFQTCVSAFNLLFTLFWLSNAQKFILPPKTLYDEQL